MADPLDGLDQIVSSRKTSEERAEDMLHYLRLLLAAGIGGIVIYFLIVCWICGEQAITSRFGVGLMVAFACTLVGGLVGFLFGIPKRLQQGQPGRTSIGPSSPSVETSPTKRQPSMNETAPPNSSVEQNPANENTHTASSNYNANTNLEEISDWLTKIIVGLGLVNLTRVPGKLGLLAAQVSIGFGSKSADPTFALSVIIYFAVCGFLYSYLWTRFFLGDILSKADGGWPEEINKLKTAIKEATRGSIGGKRASVPPSLAPLGDAVNLTGYLDQSVAMEITPGPDPDDPWRGAFGGQPESNGRRLSAKVEPISKDTFLVSLEVASTDPTRPLSGDVRLFLHPTFLNPIRSINTDPDGVARWQAKCWGAFTVGALVDNGATKLELNLANINDAPVIFRNR